MKLLFSISCWEELPATAFFCLGETKNVQSPIGTYREASAKALSRFGYRFHVEAIGQPHVAVVTYPDDKIRFMSVTDGTGYDLASGVFPGPGRPLSGQMLETRHTFWPRWTDCSIIFTTLVEGQPAAAANISVYQLDDLPLLKIPRLQVDGLNRELGIQYEDPCGACASEGAVSFDEWIDHMVAYARHSGQNSLSYPLIWYHGPTFPSARELTHFQEMCLARDRRLYVRWTNQPDDWVAALLERFSREGLEFRAALTLFRLSSLMERMNVDLASIYAGADTINNMLCDNEVQTGTNDWTVEYNILNFTKLVEGRETGQLPGLGQEHPTAAQKEAWENFPWAYGEKKKGMDRWGPIFNPLHPVVQDAVLGVIQEIIDRYAHFPAFKGVSFHLMFPPAIIWFGSLKSGYDDYTVGLFESETGICIPVDNHAPDRFSVRYDFLIEHHKEKWISWRCDRIRDLLRRIAEILSRVRDDLRLIINLSPDLTRLREGGLDLALLRHEEAIEFDCLLNTRGGLLREEAAETAQVIQGAFIMNNWFESWGEATTWHSCFREGEIAAEVPAVTGSCSGVFRMNSVFEKDGYWWQTQWRIPQVFPSGVHYLEHYAHAIAELDACRIMRGGLYLDKAHTESIQKFSNSFRALPAKKFTTVGESTDPICVRTLEVAGKCYFYLVNREFYDIRVEVTFTGKPNRLTRLSTNESISSDATFWITVEPYELATFSMDFGVSVAKFCAEIPASIVHELNIRTEKAIGALGLAAESSPPLPDADRMSVSLERAQSKRHLASLRHLLETDTVLKALNGKAS